jgi:cephalosporin hydroxylase
MTKTRGGALGARATQDVLSRAREVSKVPMEATARLTGLRVSPYVARFIAEDLAALGSYLANPSARKAEKVGAARANTTDECFAFSRSYFGVGPVQRPAEIKALLDLAQQNQARVVCEIGSRDAGTSVLFSRVLRPDTLIVMDLYAKNRWRLRRAAPRGQTVHVIDGDSTHRRSVERLRRKLSGRQLDLLLIDGDHRWSGVRQDFLNYRELVRDGGLIAFHDICRVRGAKSEEWTGDVPAFWQLVSQIYVAHEFIETPNQEGLGIGVIRYDPGVSVAPVLAAEAAPASPSGSIARGNLTAS